MIVEINVLLAHLMSLRLMKLNLPLLHATHFLRAPLRLLEAFTIVLSFHCHEPTQEVEIRLTVPISDCL